MPDSVRQAARTVQGMSDEELEEAYRDVRRSPITPDNAEYAARVESEYGTRRLIREREERDKASLEEMDAKRAERDAGTPTLDEIDERLHAGSGKGEA